MDGPWHLLSYSD